MNTTDPSEAKVKPPVLDDPPEVTDIVVVSNPPAHNDNNDNEGGNPNGLLRAYGNLVCKLMLDKEDPADFLILIDELRLIHAAGTKPAIPGKEGIYCCTFPEGQQPGTGTGAREYSFLSTSVLFKARLSMGDKYEGAASIYRKRPNGDLQKIHQFRIGVGEAVEFISVMENPTD